MSKIIASHNWVLDEEITVWKCIAEYWLTQVVYRLIHEKKDLVIKIIREKEREKFNLSQTEVWFSEIEFYGTCLDAISRAWVIMPEEYDVVHFQEWDNSKPSLSFVQTYLWNQNEFSEDERWIHLPDLWVIAWSEPRWTMRVSTFQEWFYFPNTGLSVFADWDKYLLSLKNISEKIGIKTQQDLHSFGKQITNAL